MENIFCSYSYINIYRITNIVPKMGCGFQFTMYVCMYVCIRVCVCVCYAAFVTIKNGTRRGSNKRQTDAGKV